MCWHSLVQNPEAKSTDLIVFSDGWKENSDKSSVEKVRNEIKKITGFRSVQTIARKKNLGLARSIVTGVTKICNEYGKIIVVEDDLEVSPFFLKYMNDGLKKYRNEPQVASIHGYIYPVAGRLPETFFIRGADCWGWATWARAWRLFETNAEKLLTKIKQKKLGNEFDFGGNYPFLRLLEDAEQKGDGGSWAVRWYASCFVSGKLTLYPGKSLVINQGLDSSGTHCSSSKGLRPVLTQCPVIVKKIPCKESRKAKQKFENHFNSLKSKTNPQALWDKFLEWFIR